MHGDEPKSIDLARRFIELLASKTNPRDEETDRSLLGRVPPPLVRGGEKNSETIDPETRWVIVPLINPDGHARRKRRNARRVDINRNFPTNNWTLGSPRSRMFGGPSPASEPETRAVMKLIARYRPRRIITIHSIGLERFCNNYDGPARALAAKMSRHNRYPVTASIGYPTPGSFGAYAGRQLRIPTVTLELPSTHSAKRCGLDNQDALLAAGQW
jgi:protein MpaA